MDVTAWLSFAPAVHLFAFATVFGTMIWVSFIGGIIMFKNLERHVFGNLQSHLFPAYFKIIALCLIIMMGTYVAAHDDIIPQLKAQTKAFDLSSLYDSIHPRQFLVMAFGFLFNFLNMIYVGPKSTSVMFARHKLERKKSLTPQETDEVQKLSRKFGSLHGLSSTLNLFVIACLFQHLIFISRHLSF
jgi:hypothetical protein